jgi:DNA-binding MarR family transcriptional regulator
VKTNTTAKEAFTKLQGQYLAYIVTYTKLHRRPPAEADLQRYFGVTPPSVHDMILTLEKRGLISRTPGRARAIQVLVSPEQVPALD